MTVAELNGPPYRGDAIKAPEVTYLTGQDGKRPPSPQTQTMAKARPSHDNRGDSQEVEMEDEVCLSHFQRCLADSDLCAERRTTSVRVRQRALGHLEPTAASQRTNNVLPGCVVQPTNRTSTERSKCLFTATKLSSSFGRRYVPSTVKYARRMPNVSSPARRQKQSQPHDCHVRS